MSWDHLEGNWKAFRGKVKERWDKLTDEDLDEIAGTRDQLERKIADRYGYGKDRVTSEVDDWYGSQKW